MTSGPNDLVQFQFNSFTLSQITIRNLIKSTIHKQENDIEGVFKRPKRPVENIPYLKNNNNNNKKNFAVCGLCVV